MSQAMTSEHLIRSIKKRAQIPTNQVTFTNDDFLEFADEEMLIGLVPSILQLHEDYYLVQEDVPLVANKSSYAIPSRAMGSKLRDLSYLDTAGNILEMVRILVEDESGFNNTNQGSSNLRYYYVKNNEIQLRPGLSANVSGFLRFSYYIRPNKLVLDERAGLITAIDSDTGEVTIEEFPDNFSTNISYDFLMGGSFFKVIDYDVNVTSTDNVGLTATFTEDNIFTGDITSASAVVLNVSSTDDLFVGQVITGTGIPASTTILTIDSTTQITLSNNATATTSTLNLTVPVSILPENLVVGDYVMQAGETIIPNIPTELHSVLAQRVACVCLEALGDTQGLTNATARLEKMEVALGVLIDNRVEGSPQKVVNRNSLMRNQYYWRRF